MADLPTYTRQDGAQYTAIQGSQGTALMTDREAKAAQDGLKKLSQADRELLAGAEQVSAQSWRSPNPKDRVGHMEALQNKLGDKSKAFFDRVQGALGKDVPLVDAARVSYDNTFHNGAHGKMRAVMKDGAPHLPESAKAGSWLSKEFKAVAGVESMMQHASQLASKVSTVAGKLLSKKVVAVAGAAMGVANMARANTMDEAVHAGKETMVSVVSAVDPTFVVGSSVAEAALGLKKGKDTDFGQALRAMSDGQQRNDKGLINQANLAIKREQDFLFHPEHPGQLVALHVKGKDGKEIDVKAALKDPQQRGTVIAEIDKRAAASSPDNREMFKEMKEAAQQFGALEDRRRPVPVDPSVQMATRATVAPTTPAM